MLGYESKTLLGDYIMKSAYKTQYKDFVFGKMLPLASTSVSYRQFATVQTIISKGMGLGSQLIIPATVSDATFELSTVPDLQGILHFNHYK